MRVCNKCHITPLPDTGHRRTCEACRRRRRSKSRHDSDPGHGQRRAALIEELRARASPPIGQAPGRYMKQAMNAAERRAARPNFDGKATIYTPFGPLPITRTAPDRLTLHAGGYSVHWYP